MNKDDVFLQIAEKNYRYWNYIEPYLSGYSEKDDAITCISLKNTVNDAIDLSKSQYQRILSTSRLFAAIFVPLKTEYLDGDLIITTSSEIITSLVAVTNILYAKRLVGGKINRKWTNKKRSLINLLIDLNDNEVDAISAAIFDIKSFRTNRPILDILTLDNIIKESIRRMWYAYRYFKIELRLPLSGEKKHSAKLTKERLNHIIDDVIMDKEGDEGGDRIADRNIEWSARKIYIPLLPFVYAGRAGKMISYSRMSIINSRYIENVTTFMESPHKLLRILSSYDAIRLHARDPEIPQISFNTNIFSRISEPLAIRALPARYLDLV